jgi:hypothetical protein
MTERISSACQRVRLFVLFLLPLAMPDGAIAAPSEGAADLFAIQIRGGNGFLEFPYGVLDPFTLELTSAKSFIYRGYSVWSEVSAVDPSRRKFFLLAGRSLVVVDMDTAQGKTLPFLDMPQDWTVLSLERDPGGKDLIGLAHFRPEDSRWSAARLVRIDPDTGGFSTIGDTIFPAPKQGTTALDVTGNRIFVPGFEGNAIRLSTVDLRTGEVLSQPLVDVDSWSLRTIHWDPRSGRLLATLTGAAGPTDCGSTILASIDPATGVVTQVGNRTVERTASAGTFDAEGRRLYYFTDRAVWAVDVDQGLFTAFPRSSDPPFLFSLTSIPRSGFRPETFRRGDGNVDGAVDITDAIEVLRRLFLGGDPPACWEAADADDSGTIGIEDPVALLTFLFLDGARPGEPFQRCGADPTPDGLGCQALAGCP